MHAYWRACNYLAAGMIYLARQSAAPRAAEAGAHQAPPAGPLGRQPGLELHLHSPQPPDQQVRSRRHLPGRPRPRRARACWRRSIWRAPTRRSTQTRARTRRECASSSRNSPSPAASAATARRKRRAPSTKAASWATASRTPSAPPLTIRTCWWRSWWAMAKPRPGRWPPPGTPTSS